MYQWLLLAIISLSFSMGESYAQKKDFANLARYSKQNAALPQATKKDKRVVFMGNSITEGWVRTHPDFFKTNGYIGRGISGQTSYQFLLRFREDVINLSPALVVINAGTNDVAENTQAYNEDYTFGNIISMVELAKANKIKVILTSVLPAAAFKWRMEIKDAPQKIKSLNDRIEAYAKANKIPTIGNINTGTNIPLANVCKFFKTFSFICTNPLPFIFFKNLLIFSCNYCIM